MFAAQYISYHQTGLFSKIVLEYLDQSPSLLPFYSEPPTFAGIKKAIQKKKKYPVDRNTLVEVLKGQYENVSITNEVKQNIEALLSYDTFTFCTAHQPNIFTGPLYFIYKILHVIKLADQFKAQLPANNFVPVYYMGSEDADLAELNHFTVNGKNYQWDTEQKGAVGRMIIDKKLVALIDELQHQVGIEPSGIEITSLMKEFYQPGTTIQSATFKFVNALFGKYGLVVLIADDARLKKQMLPVFEEDLFQQKPSHIVESSCERLSEHYNVQAYPREINLFYLKDNIRERIIKTNDHFTVHGTSVQFTSEEIKKELREHPERFSPNVILRGLYQEMILPNIAFIGGGGELAYWLQFKDLFENYSVSFPVLVLRNSFLIVERKWNDRIQRLGLNIIDFFKPENELMKSIVDRFSMNKISLNGNFEMADQLFEQVKNQAVVIDPTLSQHVEAIKAHSIKVLQELEKKMFRAEKRKFNDQSRQVQKIKSVLFPGNGLQERIENITTYYSKWGSIFIEELYKNAPEIEQQFTILIDQKN
jgi:bacillithiol synthase